MRLYLLLALHIHNEVPWLITAFLSFFDSLLIVSAVVYLLGQTALSISTPKMIGVILAQQLWKSCVYLRLFLNTQMYLSGMEIWKFALSIALYNYVTALSPIYLKGAAWFEVQMFWFNIFKFTKSGRPGSSMFTPWRTDFLNTLKINQWMQICSRRFLTRNKTE